MKPPFLTRNEGTSSHGILSIKKEALSLPNIMTYTRIAAIPFIIWFMQHGTRRSGFIAALIYILAGFTDLLDGIVARMTGSITVLGKFLDPLADKLTNLSVLIYMVYQHAIPPWLVVLLVIREFGITGLRTLAASEGIVIAASKGGKSKTAFQFIGVTFLLAGHPYYLVGTDIVLDFPKMGLFILYISIIFSLFSALEYTALFVESIEVERIREERKTGSIPVLPTDSREDEDSSGGRHSP